MTRNGPDPAPKRSGLAVALQSAWFDRPTPPWPLRPFAALFAAGVGLRRTLFRLGLLRSGHPGVPVVVVGNRIVGGAGKTPVTLALLAWLRSAGWRPGVVSRGYGARVDGVREVDARGGAATAAAVGDEPLLIARRSGVPVFVGRDRLAAALALRVAHAEVDVIVCDDGAQHLRLARDIDVLVFDERGIGNGALLPAGPLRETLDAPSAAPDCLVLYNAPAASTSRAGYIATRALGLPLELVDWWAGRAPQPSASTEPAAAAAWAAVQGRPVWACAGIAHPQRFFTALRERGVEVVPLPLPDHADYAELPWPASDRAGPRVGDVAGDDDDDDTAGRAAALVDGPGAPLPRDVLLTEKDAIKLDPARVARERPGQRVWVAPMQLMLPDAFLAAFDQALARARTRRAATPGAAPAGRATR